jgi:hypothetical protein
MSIQTKTRIRSTCWWFCAMLGLAVAGVWMMVFIFQGSPTPAEARSLSADTITPTATLTPTVRPVPVFLIRGVTASSPKVDGNIGGRQVNLKANLPFGNQAPRPIFGDLFKFLLKEDALNRGSRAVFVIRDSSGVEVYKHTEKNLPFCPFSDTNNQCNPIPLRNGILTWPDSEGHASQPVQPGRYFLKARIEDNNGNVICKTHDDYAFEISIGFEVPSVPVLLPASAGVAVISQPTNNAVLKGIVNIVGTATVNNFWYYKFEFVDARCQFGVCFVADSKQAMRNGILLRWDTRTIPNGTYVLQLVVVDTFGRVLSTRPRITITIQN